MPDCGMNVPCPGLSAAQEAEKTMAQRLMWVDLIREVVRNAIGLICIPFILWMLYQFVLMAPPEDKMNIMLLVIGYLGGLVTAIMGWYFGGAMRSAVQQALQQAKGGTPYVPEAPDIQPQPDAGPVPGAGPWVRRGSDPELRNPAGQPQDPSLQGPYDRQANLRRDLQESRPTGQSGQITGGSQGQVYSPGEQVYGGAQPRRADPVG
ncbi:hypothetical protein DFAR_3060011 [Desulfarculales bacterium]